MACAAVPLEEAELVASLHFRFWTLLSIARIFKICIKNRFSILKQQILECICGTQKCAETQKRKINDATSLFSFSDTCQPVWILKLRKLIHPNVQLYVCTKRSVCYHSYAILFSDNSFWFSNRECRTNQYLYFEMKCNHRNSEPKQDLDWSLIYPFGKWKMYFRYKIKSLCIIRLWKQTLIIYAYWCENI